MTRATLARGASLRESNVDVGPDVRLQELLRHYGAFLRRTIARVCPRELGLSCDDIEQDARIALWTVLKSEREIAFPASYIYKVAISASVRAIRRARGRREDPLPEEGEATTLAPRQSLRLARRVARCVAARQELRRQNSRSRCAIAGEPPPCCRAPSAGPDDGGNRDAPRME